MRKILLASNAHEVKTLAVDFACYMANITRSPVTGIFLENEFKDKPEQVFALAGSKVYETKISENTTEDTNVFCNRCIHNDARHSIHHVHGNPLREMIKESLYADVILTDGNTSFDEADG